MGLPTWWGERRFGIFVHANLATVPAFAPIGQYADWYQSHIGDPVADVLLHPTPMVEVLAHHRERWAHVERFDDFWPLLTFDRFDADAWADLVVEAGAGYTVFVSKHHDGLCWWDAPGTDRTVLHDGPRRNVLAEYAAACDRAGITFGAYYSLLDWADRRYPGSGYVDDVLHPQVLDLVGRYGARVLWGDGHWGHGPAHWRSPELVEAARRLDPDVVVNDRWWLPDADVVTYEYQTPDGIVERPWELCRGLGHSFCYNRAEREEHHLDGAGIISLLTEVVAKGGNLLLNVGPAADGTIPELQAAPLREAGAWVRQHAAVIAGSRPWHVWGDAGCRYLAADDPQHRVDVVDLHATGTFDALGVAAGRVREVVAADGGALEWAQSDDGLVVRRTDRRPTLGPPVYHVHVEPAGPATALHEATLFAPDENPEAVSLAPLLDGAPAGSIVQLGTGTYAGPARVPDGVTLRGLGPDRTVVDGGGATAIELSAGAHVEHLTVRGGAARIAWLPVPTVRVAGRGAVVLGCRIDGHVEVAASDARVRATQAAGVVAAGVDRLTVSRCRFRGMRWDVGVDVRGGSGHLVESCDIHDHLCAIRLDGAIGAVVRGNVVRARWWGIHLVGTESTEIVGNAVADTMRAVDIDGGAMATVAGNAVRDGDSGCIAQRGAAGVAVSGNRWERCRIGLLAWDVAGVRHSANAAVDLHEPDHTVTIGP
jgi:alpha-L-fucosidase